MLGLGSQKLIDVKFTIKVMKPTAVINSNWIALQQVHSEFNFVNGEWSAKLIPPKIELYLVEEGLN